MKKNLRVACTLAVCSLVLPQVAWSMPGDAVPLRITGKSLGAIPLEGPMHQTDYTLTLRNESDKTITAWKLSCLYAENDGNFSVASVQEDSFMQYERGIPSKDNRDGPVFPGGVREITVSREESTAAGPYEAMSCQVDAAIFADGSYSGLADVIEGFFEGRAQMVVDAMRAIEVLDRMTEGQSPSEEETSLVAGPFTEALHQANLWALEGDTAPIRQLRAELREQIELIEKHLPKQGRRQGTGAEHLKEGKP